MVALADLGDEHEPFARDVESMRELDLACQQEHQLVAGAEFVRAVHRAGRVRVEL